ncbi:MULTISPECIES: TRAP transporter small permease [Marinomonas]|uniref:TRAP transporter small permease protein n=1 Tax=Marinomonas rhodophyticola TaxID=2992803 RepID=A0ABT3KKP8_9GAMM|nr:TRAP transporter small permease [Marinomonas sp. KJ51-3]MCW4631124.1 TRAP transporter small permease [Marinomonas sp. KJ51-3]
MPTIRRFLDIFLGTSCSLLLLSMVGVLCWQVISRYVFNDPSTYTEELLRLGLVWLSLLGAAYSAGRGSHMAIDLLRDIARGRFRKFLKLLAPISFIIFSVYVLIMGGLHSMQISSKQLTAVLQLPMSSFYAALPVCGVLLILYAILNLIDVIKTPADEAPVDDIKKSLSMGE